MIFIMYVVFLTLLLKIGCKSTKKMIICNKSYKKLLQIITFLDFGAAVEVRLFICVSKEQRLKDL